MDKLKKGDKITITTPAVVDAIRLGLNYKAVRVDIGGTLVWVPAEAVCGTEDDTVDYVAEELKKRLAA